MMSRYEEWLGQIINGVFGSASFCSIFIQMPGTDINHHAQVCIILNALGHRSDLLNAQFSKGYNNTKVDTKNRKNQIFHKTRKGCSR